MSQYKIQGHVEILQQLYMRVPPHHKYRGIERLMMIVVLALKVIFPSFWIRHYFDTVSYEQRNRAMEFYVIGKTILGFMLGVLGLRSNPWIVGLVIYGCADLLVYLIGTIVLADVYEHPPSITRNLLLCGFNLFEIVTTFAYLYLYTQSIIHVGSQLPINSWISGFYFSMVAFTTVGFGDITPIGLVGQGLVIFELFCSIVFLGLVLSSTASRLNIKGE